MSDGTAARRSSDQPADGRKIRLCPGRRVLHTFNARGSARETSRHVLPPVLGSRVVSQGRAWSLDRAIEDALVAHGIPRGQRQRRRREATVQSLQPKSLVAAWDEVRRRLPPGWRKWADEVFVFAPPETIDCSPVAFSKGTTSRRIEVPRGFLWLMKAFGDAYAAVRGPLVGWLEGRRDSAPGEGDSFRDLWEWTLEGAQSFVVGHAAPPEVLDSILAIADFAADPRGAWESRQVGGHIDITRPVNVLLDFGLQFALAHEIGHHLLNHVDPQADVAQLGVQEQVDRWLAELGIGPPAGMNRAEAREWSADVFALMVLTRDMGDANQKDAEFWRLALLAAGAAVGLLALHVGGESLDGSAPTRSTHPRTEERLNLVVLTLTVIGRRLPEPEAFADNPDIAAEAGVVAMQVFGCAVVILELLLREQRRTAAEAKGRTDTP